MKTVTNLKDIVLQEDNSGDIWLIVPNAMINLWYIKPIVARKSFLKWAEDQLKKQPSAPNKEETP